MSMLKRSRQHLRDAGESYFEHQAVAFRYSMRCFAAGFMALVHAVVPGLCITSASELVKKLAANRKSTD